MHSNSKHSMLYAKSQMVALYYNSLTCGVVVLVASGSFREYMVHETRKMRYIFEYVS